ncbi:AraC-like DNA-binding protein [Lachnospiraceae bacterium PF1-21]
MFEHIHFFNWNLKYNSNDVFSHKDFPQFEAKYPRLMSKDSDYFIEGTSKYLLSRPLSQIQLQSLLYIQSFCIMEMGQTYFTKRQNYPSLLISYTYEGEGMLTYKEQTYQLRAGDVFVIDCRNAHHYRTQNTFWKHSDLHIWGKFAEYFYLDLLSQNGPVFHCKQESLFQNQLEKVLRQQISDHKHWAILTSHEIEKLLFLLEDLSTHVQSETPIPENIILLRTYLEHNFQTEFSLDEMAKFACMSKYHLCREFKKHIGFSPKEYVLNMRITHAMLLLQSDRIPTYQICTVVGFSNEANFIRQFKKHTGMTPGQYRKQFNT